VGAGTLYIAGTMDECSFGFNIEYVLDADCATGTAEAHCFGTSSGTPGVNTVAENPDYDPDNDRFTTDGYGWRCDGADGFRGRTFFEASVGGYPGFGYQFFTMQWGPEVAADDEYDPCDEGSGPDDGGTWYCVEVLSVNGSSGPDDVCPAISSTFTFGTIFGPYAVDDEFAVVVTDGVSLCSVQVKVLAGPFDTEEEGACP
jgi:hypothetical protein